MMTHTHNREGKNNIEHVSSNFEYSIFGYSSRIDDRV